MEVFPISFGSIPKRRSVMATSTRTSAASALAMRHQLRRLADEIGHAMRINLDPAGLSVDEWAVLSLLSDGVGHPMTDVAYAAGVPAPTATRMVDKLLGQALLHRTVDPTDGRRVLVVLAPRGRELYDRLAPAQRALTGFIAERIGVSNFEDLFERLAATTADLSGPTFLVQHL